ncbi:MAG: conjugal transfer protein TraF [Gammaproteobacteria bacterium]|nr:conjugal transfer protein TraF [Gammaproteobacteria bacterium]
MKLSTRFTTKKLSSFLIISLMFFNINSLASTQEERVAKIDAFGENLTNKVGSFLGNKPRNKKNNSAGRWGQYDKTNKQRSPLIHKFIYEASDADKFVFFYRGKDQKSESFGKTLKKYSDETDMKVIAYTVDNRSLPSFPESTLATHKTIEQYFGSSNANVRTPTLFLKQYDTYAIPIAENDIPYMELIKRMNKAAEERIAQNPKKYGY